MQDQEAFDLQDYSVANLKYLAKELAINYFHGSVIDMIQTLDLKEDKDKVLKDLWDEVFDKKVLRGIKGYEGLSHDTEAVSDKAIDHQDYTRNILVIGAGCTCNAFSDMYTAEKALIKIYENIKVGSVISPKKIQEESDVYKNQATQEVKKEEIDLYYLLRYYAKHTKTMVIDQGIFSDIHSPLNNEVFNDYLERELKLGLQDKHPQASQSILKETARKFFEEYERLNIYRSEKEFHENMDFELSLHLLSKVFSIRTVRRAIQGIYNQRFGPTLFYDLVAHLFKHRFIDVIINFNFDEFLDQAIEEELDDDAFDIILSDGDCLPLEAERSQSGRLRQPLYIKPHGTASHKSTLRFTKDHYDEMPIDMKDFLKEIIACNDQGENNVKKRVNLITVGFEMVSKEFNNILRTAPLPENSQIFSFCYNDSQNEKNTLRTYENRFKSIKDALYQPSSKPKLYLIGHEYFNEILIKDQAQDEENRPHYKTPTLGNTFFLVYSYIRQCYMTKYKPRRITNHLIVNHIFGNESFYEYARTEQEIDQEKGCFPKSYFTSQAYFQDRLLVEILIDLTINKGKMDPPLFMQGRVGRYYSYYFNAEGGELSLADLIFFYYRTSPRRHRYVNKTSGNHQKVGLNPLNINDFEYFDNENYSRFFMSAFNLVTANKSFYSNQIKRYLIDEKEFDSNCIQCLFELNRKSNRSTIHSAFRSNTLHIFLNYNLSDMITTDLALDLYFTKKLIERELQAVYIIAEFGVQLANFLSDIVEQGIKVYIILADYRNFSNSKTRQAYKKDRRKSLENIIERSKTDLPLNKVKECIDILFLPINRHNHHMTIFKQKDGETDLTYYYYQQGISKQINPIRIQQEPNLDYLKNKFNKYYESAKVHCKVLDKEWNTFTTKSKYN